MPRHPYSQVDVWPDAAPDPVEVAEDRRFDRIYYAVLAFNLIWFGGFLAAWALR